MGAGTLLKISVVFGVHEALVAHKTHKATPLRELSLTKKV